MEKIDPSMDVIHAYALELLRQKGDRYNPTQLATAAVNLAAKVQEIAYYALETVEVGPKEGEK